MNYGIELGSEEINRRKTVSDEKNDTEDLTFHYSREPDNDVISRKILDDLMEKKRLKDELKEVWEH